MSRRDSRSAGAVARLAGSAGRGIGAATGAICRVFGLLGGKRRSERPSSKRESWWARRKRERGGTTGGALEADIAGLERELDQIYGEIVRGAGHVALDDPYAESPDLTDTLERARQLKRDLRAKRAELARSTRVAARRSRLLKTAGQRTAPERDRAPEPASAAPRVAERFEVSGKLRKAIARAGRSAAFHDAAQQIVFEKTVHDMEETDPEVRRTAAARLGDLGTTAAIDILCGALEDPDSRVRVAALNSLALIGDPSTTAVFQRFAASPDHHLRLAALRGLSRTDDREGDPSIVAGIDDEHPAIRRAAATFLGWRRDRSATKQLMRALRDEEEQVRAAAAAALGNIRDDRAVLSLIRALEDPALTVRQAAKTALEATLAEELAMDLSAAVGEGHDERVAQLKDWWKSARVEMRTERIRIPRFEEGLPRQQPREGRLAAPEPAAPAAGLAADDGLASLEALGVGPAAEQPAGASAVDGLGDDEGLAGLESLGVSAASVSVEEPAAEATGTDDDGLSDLESLGVIGADEPLAIADGAIGEDAGSGANEGLDSGLDSAVEDLGLGGLDIRTTATENDGEQPKEKGRAAEKDSDKGSKSKVEKDK